MSAELVVSLTVAVPLAGSGLIVAAGARPNLREAVSLVCAAVLFLLMLALLPEVLAGGRPALELVEPVSGVALAFAVEPLGMLFALVASGLWIVTTIYSIGYMRGNNERNQTRYYAYFAVALGSTMGIAFAANLFTLFVFYEALTVSTYPLVTHKGSKDAMRAGRTYLGVLIGSSMGLLLPAIIWTWTLTGTTTFVAGGLLAGHLEGPLVSVMLALYVFGIGKAALMPVHRWLPAAMVAPTPVSALLHAVAVVKAGVFCVVKIVVYVFGLELLADTAGAGWFLYAAAVTVLLASVIALRQDNLKRRLAYSTISQLSYVVLGAAILAPLSAVAAALHVAAHAFGKITLFFAAGSIYTAAHKTEVSQLDGIGWRMPWTMTAFSIGALSMIGVPPAAGFISKWYLLFGAFEAGQIAAVVVIILSTLLNAAYFVPIIYCAWFRREAAGADPVHGEAPLPIVAALTISATLTVLLFLFPGVPLELARQMMAPGP